MIKKLVSNALLSMVMDKKAREKFNAAQEAKTRAKAEADPKAKAALEPAQPAPNTASGAAPRAQAKAPVPSRNAPSKAAARARPPADDEEDAETLIRQALEEAELEFINKRKKKSMTPERQALIEQAMAIHRSKSHVLDDLPPEQRDKLTFMAMKALDPKFGE
jgi:hypothetical protein